MRCARRRSGWRGSEGLRCARRRSGPEGGRCTVGAQRWVCLCEALHFVLLAAPEALRLLTAPPCMWPFETLRFISAVLVQRSGTFRSRNVTVRYCVVSYGAVWAALTLGPRAVMSTGATKSAVPARPTCWRPSRGLDQVGLRMAGLLVSGCEDALGGRRRPSRGGSDPIRSD
jgi:hypothetical protein